MINIAEQFAEWKSAGHRIASLTAYDYPTARLLEEAGIDVILVGDSLGMVVLGREDTTTVTLSEMLHHAKAVVAGVSRTPVVADLSAGSYETPAMAVESSRALMASGAHAVKLEGDLPEIISAIVAEGIPVVAHLGMLPQHVREEGGYHRKGRTDAEKSILLQQAVSIENSGACAVVLELVDKDVTAAITSQLRIPTIGIGSGDQCDGQILVTHDLVGMFPWFRPKFAKPEAGLAAEFKSAVERYIQRGRDQ